MKTSITIIALLTLFANVTFAETTTPVKDNGEFVLNLLMVHDEMSEGDELNLYLDPKFKGGHIYIYGQKGELLLKDSVEVGDNQIDTKKLTTGVYQCVIIANNIRVQQQLVIKPSVNKIEPQL